jgi:hypothetical protein
MHYDHPGDHPNAVNLQEVITLREDFGGKLPKKLIRNADPPDPQRFAKGTCKGASGER